MSQTNVQLQQVVIKGYKSIKACDIKLNNINVFIGANGAGKSNFISAFELLKNYYFTELVRYGAQKGVNSLFYNGKKVTEEIEMSFDFYDFKHDLVLRLSESNDLVVAGENIKISTDRLLFSVYHFHDTSVGAKMKLPHNIDDSITLHADAGNLAAYLYRLKHQFPDSYRDIRTAIQMVAPYFRDFVLEAQALNNEQIFLRWQQKGQEDVLMPSQFSDGTLRFICLTTLLLQPAELQPATIIIDEPELGLHPFAIAILAEMVRKAAVNKQIIIATQSVELLNHFNVEDVVVVDNGEDGSQFRRLDENALQVWLDGEYSLGELWSKNIFGGRP